VAAGGAAGARGARSLAAGRGGGRSRWRGVVVTAEALANSGQQQGWASWQRAPCAGCLTEATGVSDEEDGGQQERGAGEGTARGKVLAFASIFHGRRRSPPSRRKQLCCCGCDARVVRACR